MTVLRETLSASEAEREIRALREAGEKIRRSRETAKAFLVKHGFITAKGQLAKRYRE